MSFPTVAQAQQLLAEAETLNPGPWVQHSIYVAQAAEHIARHLPDLDPQTALILGYLHDIGRRFGVTDNRHILDGYLFLQEQGHPHPARIALTHSFPIQNPHAVAGQ